MPSTSLASLLVAGCVTDMEGNEGTEARFWVLTQEGVSRLVLCRWVGPKEPLLHNTVDDPEDMTKLELLQSLLERGWKWQCAPKRAKNLKYAPGEAKLLYSRRVTLLVAYLRCLLLWDAKTDPQDVLLHLQPAKYYERLLAGRPSPEARGAELHFMADGENDEPAERPNKRPRHAEASFDDGLWGEDDAEALLEAFLDEEGWPEPHPDVDDEVGLPVHPPKHCSCV